MQCAVYKEENIKAIVGERGANEAPGQKRPLLRFLLTAQGCKGLAGYCLCLVRATFSALTCSMKHGS